jgi:maltose/moltooligosaccharide transporter
MIERPPLTKATTLLYSAGSIGAGAFYAFNNFVLPQLLRAYGAGDLLIGLLSSTRSIEGALIQPTVGALSDRIWTRIGRRRPFILVAIPLSSAFFLLAAGAPDLITLAVAIFLFSIFFNTAIDPYAALLADVAAPTERGILSGVSTGIQLVSQVLFLVLISRVAAAGTIPSWTYVLVATVMLGTFLVTVVGVHEPRGLAEHRERHSMRDYVGALLAHRDAVKYLLCVFTYMFAFSAVLPYLTLFIVDDIHQTEGTALILSAATLLVTAAAAVAWGKVADRIGTKPVLVIGWTLLGVAAIGGMVIQALPETVVVVILAGIGNGAATAIGWPLLASLVPPEETGVFAGLKAAADSIAIPLSVVVAAEVFLPRFGYRGIFGLLAIFTFIALAMLIVLVRVPKPAQLEAAPVPA